MLSWNLVLYALENYPTHMYRHGRGISAGGHPKHISN